MCGYFFVAERGGVGRDRFARALDGMVHRGPDGTGTLFRSVDIQGGDGELAFGHQRLAILDVTDRADQPFSVGNDILAFNGEIYNFAALRDEHFAGETFASSGDTEVLCRLLHRDGIDAIPRLEGFWSFVQFDSNARQLIVARDFYGKKPCFTYQDKSRFIVSSTIAAIIEYLGRDPEFDRDYFASYLTRSLVPLRPGQTPYRDIMQVRPGHALTVDLATWAVVERDLREEIAANASTEGLTDRLRNAVLKRLVSDRPIALLLSGGVDSSLILSILAHSGHGQSVECVIGDTGVSKDAEYARESIAALGLKARVVPISYDGRTFDDFLDICRNQEAPFRVVGNLVALPQLYRAIAETDVRVVLDGTGADEVFGGYWDRLYPFALRDAVRGGDITWLLRQAFANRRQFRRFMIALRNAFVGTPERDVETERLVFQRDIAVCEQLDPLLGTDLTFAEASYTDIFAGRLQEWLWQNDRNAMAFGLEGRSPFLDRDLFAFAMESYKDKFKLMYNKHQLRSAFDDFHRLPTQWRVEKQGFRWNPASFVSANRERVLALLEQSELLPSIIANWDEMLERAREDDQWPNSLLAPRLLAVAAVEHVMRNSPCVAASELVDS